MAYSGVNRTDLEKKKIGECWQRRNSRGRYPTIGLSLLAPVSLCSLTKIAVDLRSVMSVLPCSHFTLRGCPKCGSHTLQST